MGTRSSVGGTQRIQSAISSRLQVASSGIGNQPARASGLTAALRGVRSSRRTMTRSSQNSSSRAGTAGKPSNGFGGASTRTRFGESTRTFRSIVPSSRRERSSAGNCGPRWSRTCVSPLVFGAAVRGRNGSPRLPPPSSRAAGSRAGLRSRSRDLRSRSGPLRGDRNRSREVAMRFRLDVDGGRREIDVERSAAGFAIRIDGAVYEVRTRSTPEFVDVRIGTKRFRIRLQGNEAILYDGVHRLRREEASEVRAEAV